MWMGNYDLLSLFGLFIQTVFVQNILLFNFLGMCSYLACSNKISTANGLGLAVAVFATWTGFLTWFVHRFITGAGALSWIGLAETNLTFLELILYIAVIAASGQILEILIDRFSPALYATLGVYLPLITVNCAILGAILFATAREYAFWPNLVYVSAAGLGWWLAIVLIAAIREKLSYSDIPKGLQGMGITFIITGLIALAFMGLTGITLDRSGKKPVILHSGFQRNP